MHKALDTAAQMLAAALVAVIVAVVALVAISRVDWPAFPSSNQLHALTTAGQVGCLIALVGTGWLWRRGRQWLARIGAAVLLSAFAVVTLGMPLGATRLYLFGISVDQQFRTEYLTRLTDSPALHDMTYAGLPPFYPPGWFWIGGRAAAFTGMPAWEMFKPWAITSIAMAVAVAMVLWSELIRFEYALVVTTATATVTLAYSATEPYSAIITMLIPPVLVLAWAGLRGGSSADSRVAALLPSGANSRVAALLPSGANSRVAALPPSGANSRVAALLPSGGGHSGWAAVIGVGVFLGFTATFYTLLLAYTAFTVTVMAVIAAIARRSVGPLVRLAVIAVIAAGIGAVTWLPFLVRAARTPLSGTGSAQHYLPGDGAVLNFPMLQFSLLGALCMLGTVWLAWRARSSVRAASLGIGVLALYGWSLLSMLTTLAGTTLLSFRLQPTLTVLLAAAGVFGFLDVARVAAGRWGPAARVAATAVGLIGAIGFSQDIPNVLRPDLNVAYTDTDGNGQRGDRRPPGAEKYYERIDAAIREATGRPRNETVVMTADYSFLSYYPYYGFQGLTSHYANPLAQFGARAAAIESWGKLTSAAEFTRALDQLPWPPPSVFLMRRSGAAGTGDSFTLRLAEDVYPNQPNVRRYSVDLDAALFAAPYFAVKTVGPFVLAIRTPH